MNGLVSGVKPQVSASHGNARDGGIRCRRLQFRLYLQGQQGAWRVGNDQQGTAAYKAQVGMTVGRLIDLGTSRLTELRALREQIPGPREPAE